jgi:hypothetical protein
LAGLAAVAFAGNARWLKKIRKTLMRASIALDVLG